MKRICRIIVIAFVLTLTGCARVTPISQEITMELGQSLSEDPAQFVNVSDETMLADIIMDFSEIDFKKAGTYTANAVYKEKNYPITIHIQDTTAPEAALNTAYLILQPNTAIIASDLFEFTQDKGEVTTGFLTPEREGDLEVCTLEELDALPLPEGQIQTLDAEETLSEKIELGKEGIYKLPVAAKDDSGNMVVYELPAYVDGTAPVLEQTQTEIVIKIVDDMFAPTFTGYTAIDNFQGDITDSEYTEISLEVLRLSENGADGVCRYYITSIDEAGNKAEAHWDATVKIEVNMEDLFSGTMAENSKQNTESTNSTAVTNSAAAIGSVYGPKLNQNQLNEVQAAVDAFLANYITFDMSDYDKVKTAHDYLVNTVSYAASWAENGANTAWGALVYHEAQCSGYARAFKALCDGMGIGCYYVHADANASNPSHQWNTVQVNGNWYIVDVQANDDSGYNVAFLVSDDYYRSISSMSWDTGNIPACPSNYQ